LIRPNSPEGLLVKGFASGLGNDFRHLVIYAFATQEPLHCKGLLAKATVVLSLSGLDRFPREALGSAQGFLCGLLPVPEGFGDRLGTLADGD
jgi:hypothetical protein